MTPQDDPHADLEAAAERATPGPWQATQTSGEAIEIHAAGEKPRRLGPIAVCWYGEMQGSENASFIVAARNALPALLAELREATEKLVVDSEVLAYQGTELTALRTRAEAAEAEVERLRNLIGGQP